VRPVYSRPIVYSEQLNSRFDGRYAHDKTPAVVRCTPQVLEGAAVDDVPVTMTGWRRVQAT